MSIFLSYFIFLFRPIPTCSDEMPRDGQSEYTYLRLPRFSILLAKRVTKVTIEIWHIGLWSRVREVIQERIIDDVVHILHRNGSSNHSTLIYLHDFASKILYGFICKIVSIIHEKKEKKDKRGSFLFFFLEFSTCKKKSTAAASFCRGAIFCTVQ